MSKPTIGFFALYLDPPCGGCEISTWNYFKKLSKYYSIHCFCFLSDNSKFKSEEFFIKDKIHITRSNRDIPKVMDEFIKEKNPDMIVSQLFFSDVMIDQAAKHGVPVVFFSHGIFEDFCMHQVRGTCHYQDILTCPYERGCLNSETINNYAKKYNYCSEIVCNSKFMIDAFNRFFPDLNNINLVYPDFDYDLFYDGSNSQIDHDKTIVFAVNSNITKGSKFVVDLARNNPDKRFIYAGCSDAHLSWFAFAPNIEAHGKVSREQMKEFYKMADVTILPTQLHESFSGVAYESILCGTPVLASNKGNLKYIISDSSYGKLFDNFDAQEWTDGINEYSDKRVPEDKMKIVMDDLNENNSVEKIRDIFDKVINREKPKEIEEPKVEVIENKQKKVLFLGRFLNPSLGGAEFFILAVLKYLQKLGYDCSGVCYADPATEKRFTKSEKIIWDGIPVYREPIMSTVDISRIMDEHSPDLVITHSFDAPIIVSLAKQKGIKTILGVHFWRNICGVKDRFFNMLERPMETVEVYHHLHHVFEDADQVYVNSEFMKQAVKRYTGKEIENKIHPMLDMDRVVSKKERDPKYILLVNSDIGKGGGLFAKIASAMPNYDFLCLGLGAEIIPQNVEINKKIKGIPNIKILEKTDNVADVYRQAKILLAPSLVDETFSMVALEAMANGVPVLASPNGNFPYLVKGGGMILPTEDINHWIQAIESLYSNKDSYNTLSENALQVASLHLPEVELKKFHDLVIACIGEI